MAAAAVPEFIAEEYYQISDAILDSFPKYRPPLDLFVLNEELCLLKPYFKKGDRLSNEQVDKVHSLCLEGNLFVSRADYPIYSKHIIKQLDLVLADDNLKPAEIADICIAGMAMRLTDFFEQPVKIVYDPLEVDCMVVTEFLWTDRHRLKIFMRRLSMGTYSLINHSINTMIIGLWLLNLKRGAELTRKEFDRAAIGFLLHDVGMTKIPSFITSKNTPLKIDEKEKIPPHTLIGAKILQKLDLVNDEVKHIMLEHHERIDGSGYPLKTKNLSLLGSIAAVADSFSAIIQEKPYGSTKSPLDAARALSAEVDKYDRTITAKLLTAYVTNEFSMGR